MAIGQQMAFSQWCAVFVSRLEFLFKRTLLRRFRSFNPEEATAGVDYSKASLRKFGFDDRVTWTTKMLSSFPDTDKTNLLCIGPRYTTELRIAKTYGFEWKGIRGFDTFSYSKKVDTGDMHALPYTNSEFSNILCGWTLSYSIKPDEVVNELVRVCAPGGYILVSMQFVDVDDTTHSGVIDGILEGRSRIQTLGQLDELFIAECTRVVGLERVGRGPWRHTIVVYKKTE
jgi:hypothetical protein